MIGTKTMQMLSVATKAGVAIWLALSRMVSRSALPSGSSRLVFSTSTVASSTRMPTARASPPSVIMLIVSPSELRVRSDVRMASGIEIGHHDGHAPATQKNQDHGGSQKRRDGSLPEDSFDGAAHEQGLVGDRRDLQVLRKRGLDSGQGRLAHSRNDVQGGRLAGLKDGHQGGTVAFYMDDVRLKLKAVMHVGDVANVYGRRR